MTVSSSIDRDEVAPHCWSCGAVDVTVAYDGHRRAYCIRGCSETHAHYEDVSTHRLRCRACGNDWIDGSGDFAASVRS